MNCIERLGLLQLEIEEKRHGRLSLQPSTTGGNNEDGDSLTARGCLTALM